MTFASTTRWRAWESRPTSKLRQFPAWDLQILVLVKCHGSLQSFDRANAVLRDVVSERREVLFVRPLLNGSRFLTTQDKQRSNMCSPFRLIYLSIYRSVHLSIGLSIHPPINPSAMDLAMYPSTYLSYPSIYLVIYRHAGRQAGMHVCTYVCMYVCMCACVCVYR